MNDLASHCPAAKAADILGDKWNLLILRAMLLGARRYSDFNSAMPRISPSVLSGRLKQLAENGLILKRGGSGQQASYRLTPAGRSCEPMLLFLAEWGKAWAQRTVQFEGVEVGSAMWDLHKTMVTEELPDGETVMNIHLTDVEDFDRWWIVACDGLVDLCNEDPGKDVDLYINAPLERLVAVWGGDAELASLIRDEEILLTGESYLVNSASRWFPVSPAVKAKEAGLSMMPPVPTEEQVK